MAEDYDLVVIGGGSGGVRAARIAGGYGARVAIIEEYRVGGTCVIRGCVPKKLFVFASRYHDLFELAPTFGWDVGQPTFDWPTLVANKDKEIARLEKAYVSGLEGAGAEVLRDRAVVTGPNTVRLVREGRELAAKTILVATGAHPFVPDIPGRELGITSNEAFHLDKLPHSILIEGGGYVGVEFATIFAGLGVDTTLVSRGDRVLRGFDADLREGLEAGLQTRGVKLIYRTGIAQLTKAGHDVRAGFSDGVDAPYGAVMFATGRRPNTAGLGLEAAGIELDAEGAVRVDSYSRTSIASVYAVGDVTNRVQLTPVAIREGHAFADTVFGGKPTEVDLSLYGTAVFAEPELASVGLSEEAACTHGDIDVYIARFRPMLNTLSLKSDRMIMKLITLRDGGTVLGVHVLGPGAAEIVQMAAIPMGMGANKADFDRAIAMHPTAAEELVTFRKPSYVYRDGAKH